MTESDVVPKSTSPLITLAKAICPPITSSYATLTQVSLKALIDFAT